MTNPVLRTDVTKAVEFSSGVILVQNRTPPLQHLFLHFHRTGGRGVYGHFVSRQVPLISVFFSEF